MKHTKLVFTKIDKIKSGDIFLDRCGKELTVKGVKKDFSTKFGTFVFYVEFIGGHKKNYFLSEEVMKVERKEQK